MRFFWKLSAAIASEVHAQLTQFSVQMGALQAGLLCHARHGAAFAGQVEFDACIMDGPTRRAGAVAVIQNVRSPINAARAVMDAHALKATAGATSPNGQVVVVRALAPQVEPAMQLLQQVRAAWRAALWQLDAEPPRIWSM